MTKILIICTVIGFLCGSYFSDINDILERYDISRLHSEVLQGQKGERMLKTMARIASEWRDSEYPIRETGYFTLNPLLDPKRREETVYMNILGKFEEDDTTYTVTAYEMYHKKIIAVFADNNVFVHQRMLTDILAAA